MKVELFQAGGCRRCAASRETLKSVAQKAVPGVVWRDVDAAAELDYAVQLGVMTLPAVAVDGRLVFASLPTPAQLIEELLRRTQGVSHGH